ncbi:pentapeptide repeat-containing protein [Streptomyces sp. NBC_00286]|uniref:pentapeptide repeat-containing protein n=1 Tax=Streptomyces sp. NBC_00286 TaxID=2975701 RepID=UPI002E2B4484|nr:pentapeptide repeat-containing protein [Streptomyces sp. NBC_00286]
MAKAIREDQHAVVQGITTRFNSGVNEGRITDLNRDTKIDLRFADLRGVELRNRNLSGFLLSGADLRNARLAYADLRETASRSRAHD